MPAEVQNDISKDERFAARALDPKQARRLPQMPAAQNKKADSKKAEEGKVKARPLDNLRDKAQGYKRQLDIEKKKAKQIKAKKVLAGAQGVEEKIRKIKRIYRIINAGSALTLVGILLTFLVMNLQLIFANLMPVAKMLGIPLPKLDMWEIAVILIIDVIVGFVLAVCAIFVIMLINIIKEVNSGSIEKWIWHGIKSLF